MRFRKPWHIAGREGYQGALAPKRQEHAEASGEQAHQQALRDQLSQDSALAGTECGANGDFPGPSDRLCEQHVGEVGARYEQHHANCGQHDPKRETEIADHCIAHACDRHVFAAVAVGILLLEARADRGHLRLRFCEVHLRLKARDHVIVVCRAGLSVGENRVGGEPDVGFVGESEA